MAVVMSKIRLGLVLPLLIAIILSMLAGYQASGLAVPAEKEVALAQMAGVDGDCVGNDPMHSTACCTTPALAPGAIACSFDAPLGVNKLVNRGSEAAEASRLSKLFRPPRAA